MNRFREMVSYLIFGVLTTVVNIVCFWVLDKGMGVDYKMATVLAWTLAVVFAFFTNKKYVFQSKSSSFRSVLREFGSFIFFRLLSLLLDLACMILLVELLAVDSLLAKVIANVFVVIFNYFASKFVVFRASN